MEARRSDKTYPMTSPELMRELGAYLLGMHNYLQVDVQTRSLRSLWRFAITVRIFTARKYPVRAVCPWAPVAVPEYAVWRHRQPGGSLPDGKARSGPGPHSFCVPSVYF